MVLVLKENDKAIVTVADAIESNFYAILKTGLEAAKPFDAVEIEICSEGGVLTEAFAAYNYLKSLPCKVTMTVTGWAASAATYLLMAADHVVMQENSFLMIHEPSVFSWDSINTSEAEKLTAMLTLMRDTIVQAYLKKSSLDAATLETYMKEETWLTAAEALEYGFCDEIAGVASIAAKANIPEKIKEKIMAKKKLVVNQEAPVKEVEKEEIAPAAEEKSEQEEKEKDPAEQPAEEKSEQEETEKDPVAELEEKVLSLEEENESLNKEIAELKAEKETAEQELSDVKNRIEKMNSGVKVPVKSAGKKEAEVNTWKEAMSACNGDYMLARKKYPEIFNKLMEQNRK